MARCAATVTALLLLVVNTASGVGQPFYYFSGAPAPVVPQFYVYDTAMVASPVAPEPALTGPLLKCAAEGFFPHPTNCARFYRCVDYAGTGQFFSRYEFECPAGQMFLAVGKNTCVPGDCDGVVPIPTPPPAPAVPVGQGPYPSGSGPPPSTGPVGDDPSAYPQPAPAPEPIDSSAPDAGAAYPQPGGSTPVGTVGAAPAPGATAETGGASPGAAYPGSGAAASPDSPAPVQPGVPQPTTAAPPPPVYPEPVTAAPAGSSYPDSSATTAPPPPPTYPQSVTPATSTGDNCPAKYVQDGMYCNIYLRCPDDSQRYMCVLGTVFDQARQMCRLSDQEDVCAGKPMFSPDPAFRADLPHLNQGGPAQIVSRQTFPSFSQVQSFPSFRQGNTFPSFSQVQSFPSFSHVQSSPSFSQGQTFPLFSQGQSFSSFNPASQRLVYTPQVPSYSAQVPSYTAVGGGPADFVSAQGTSFYAQPTYFVGGK